MVKYSFLFKNKLLFLYILKLIIFTLNISRMITTLIFLQKLKHNECTEETCLINHPLYKIIKILTYYSLFMFLLVLVIIISKISLKKYLSPNLVLIIKILNFILVFILIGSLIRYITLLKKCNCINKEGIRGFYNFLKIWRYIFMFFFIVSVIKFIFGTTKKMRSTTVNIDE
jgi:hypothetical protein